MAVAQELGELFEADAVLFGDLSRETHAARRVGHDAVRTAADSRTSRRGDTVDAIGVGEQAGDRAVAWGGGVDLVHAAGQLVQMSDVDGSRAEQPQAADFDKWAEAVRGREEAAGPPPLPPRPHSALTRWAVSVCTSACRRACVASAPARPCSQAASRRDRSA